MSALLNGQLKFRHLLLVDAISRHGTLVGAAEELLITQPAATRTLRELEDMLGLTLFERHPRGLAPTPFSEAFTTHARAVLAQIRQAEKHLAELRDADRGTLVLGTHLAGANSLVPRAVARLKQRHPQLTVVLREALPTVLLAELESGRIDMVVGRLTRPSDETFIRRKLQDESVLLAVREGHPLLDRASIEPPELSGYPWILPSHEVRLRGELEAFFGRHGIDLPQNRVETTSYLVMRHLLLETDAIAACPQHIMEELPRVVPLDLRLDRVGQSVGVTVSATRAATPAAERMLRILYEVAGE